MTLPTDSALTPLQCPKCGASLGVPGPQGGFGQRVQCSYCGTLSVLVIDRELLVSHGGENVCVDCGRVGVRAARFFQSCLHAGR